LAGREHRLADDDGQLVSRLPHRGAAADAATDPSRMAEQRDLAARLRELLKDLRAPQRETIDLWCEGLSYKQIAEITGRTEGNVRVLAHRGLTALRSHPQVQGLLSDHRGRAAAAMPQPPRTTERGTP
jgi:RNA polymerase sigma factor (sigma-70 family)